MTDRKQRVSDAHLAYVLEMAKDFHHEFGFSEDEWLAFAFDLRDSRERVRELEAAIIDGPKWHAFPCTYCVPSRMWTENGRWQVEHATDCITADIRRRKENA